MRKHIITAAAAIAAIVGVASPALADPPWARGRHFEERRWEHRRWERDRWEHGRRDYGPPRGYRNYGYYAPPPAPGIYIPFR